LDQAIVAQGVPVNGPSPITMTHLFHGTPFDHHVGCDDLYDWCVPAESFQPALVRDWRILV